MSLVPAATRRAQRLNGANMLNLSYSPEHRYRKYMSPPRGTKEGSGMGHGSRKSCAGQSTMCWCKIAPELGGKGPVRGVHPRRSGTCHLHHPRRAAARRGGDATPGRTRLVGQSALGCSRMEGTAAKAYLQTMWGLRALENT